MSHTEAITDVIDAWRRIAGHNPIAANFVRILDGLPEAIRFDAFASLFESIPKTTRHTRELADVTTEVVTRRLPDLEAELEHDDGPGPLGEAPPIDPLDFLRGGE